MAPVRVTPRFLSIDFARISKSVKKSLMKSDLPVLLFCVFKGPGLPPLQIIQHYIHVLVCCMQYTGNKNTVCFEFALYYCNRHAMMCAVGLCISTRRIKAKYISYLSMTRLSVYYFTHFPDYLAVKYSNCLFNKINALSSKAYVNTHFDKINT